MMYHFETRSGESPDPATVNEAPFEPYVGLPWAVNESEAPEVKSIFTDLPSAVSGGQLPLRLLADDLIIETSLKIHTTCERIAVGVGLS